MTAFSTAYSTAYGASMPFLILTLDEAKEQLTIDASDTRNDDEIATYLPGLVRVVENEIGQAIEPREFTDEFVVDSATSFLLGKVPVISLDAVQRLDGAATTWDVGTMHVNKATGKVSLLDTTVPLAGLVQITYHAGYDPVPVNFKRGAGVILQHAWELQRGVGTVSPVTVDTGDDWRWGAGFLVPRRAREWLGTAMPGLP